MPLIDDEGRLFGRVNLIDAAVVTFVLLLVPVAYTAFVLFRTPAPTLTAIEPAAVVEAPEMRVKLRGDGLRPLLRAYIGEIAASAYLYENDHSIDVLFTGVPPGRHDLILYDGVQEVLRAQGGVNVVLPVPAATTQVVAAGWFIGLDAARAAAIASGQRSEAAGQIEMEILETGPPRPDTRVVTAGESSVFVPVAGLTQVPALVRLRCAIVETTCSVGGGAIESGRSVIVPHPGGTMRFLVDYLLPATPSRTADVTVRFLVDRDAAATIKAGDREASISNIGPAAQVTSVGAIEVSGGETARSTSEPGGIIAERRTADRLALVNVVLRLDLHESPYGRHHRSQLIRVGSPFTFNGPDYRVSGSIVGVRLVEP